MPIASIVFLQGDEGRKVVDALTHTEGIEVRGVTTASIVATVEHLAQWDTGEYHDLGTTTRAGIHDHRQQVDHYLLTWNSGLGYVGLEVMLDDTGQIENNATCYGCWQPIDYCTDHTHAPDTESEDWTSDYDAVTAALTADTIVSAGIITGGVSTVLHTEEEPVPEYENPVIIVSDGGPMTVIETNHDEIMDAIRAWHSDLTKTRREAVSTESLHDRYVMAEAALVLIEVDQATGISLERFGAVSDLVSRVVAYAFGHDPHYTTVHWPVH